VLPRPVLVTWHAQSLPSTSRDHSNMTQKEQLPTVFSSAEQRVCLQSSFYLSLLPLPDSSH
jgi:hypothetical protein